MPHLNSINKLPSSEIDPFVIKINDAIDKLNFLIERYNASIEPTKQIEALKKIYLFRGQIENIVSDTDVSLHSVYRDEIQDKLFVSLQDEFKKYGITSLYHSTTYPLPSYTLPVILANMAPKKVNKLLEILSAGATFNIDQLIKLYEPFELGFADYQFFLNNNNIRFLGGNNSKNFKITPKVGGKPFILKVDNRMGEPKYIVEHLKAHSLKETILPILTERQASCYQNGRIITRTLLITQFCDNTDLDTQSKQYGINYDEHIKKTLNIYSQMASILLGISQDQCAFPDMKNSNWLIDSSGLLKLADTKSFVPIQPNGTLDLLENEKKGFYLLRTNYLSPPEMKLSVIYSADKMHSYMLGKNLYQYLTGCDASYLAGKDSSIFYDFSRPIFHSMAGKTLQRLIEALIQPNPYDRISVAQALLELEKIQCILLLKEIFSYNLGEKDIEKSLFVQAEKLKIDKAHLGNVYQLKQQLTKVLMEEKQYALDIAKAECTQLLKEIFSYNLGEKDTEKQLFVQATAAVLKANDANLDNIYQLKQQLTKVLKDEKQYVNQVLQKNKPYWLNKVENYMFFNPHKKLEADDMIDDETDDTTDDMTDIMKLNSQSRYGI